MMNNKIFDRTEFDAEIAENLLLFADLVSRRGYVVNTLGNIAVRVPHSSNPVHGVIYTKHLGVSLEEMTMENVVVTDVIEGQLLYGKESPSIGHALNRKAFMARDDVNAVMHLHANELISYFSVTGERELKYISADTALILAKPVWVLEPNINVEIDASLLDDFVHKTNCIVMPNHGATTFGRDLSEAYHRMTSVVAEVQRIILAMQIASSSGKQVKWISDEEVADMYKSADSVIYGK